MSSMIRRSCWNAANTLGAPTSQSGSVFFGCLPCLKVVVDVSSEEGEEQPFLPVSPVSDAEAMHFAPCTWVCSENMSSNIYLQLLKSRGSIQNLFSLRIIEMLVLSSA